MIWTIAKVSIIRNASDQFHMFLIPNQIEPNKKANKLNDNTNLDVIVYLFKFVNIVIRACLYKLLDLICIDIVIFTHLGPLQWLPVSLFER